MRNLVSCTWVQIVIIWASDGGKNASFRKLIRLHAMLNSLFSNDIAVTCDCGRFNLFRDFPIFI